MNLFFINIAYASESMDQFIMNVNKMIINPIIILLFALATIFFLYGVFEFISNLDNEEAKTKGKSHMIWGIIGITKMMGVFMIMKIIMNTFNIQGINVDTETVNLPPAN